MTSSEESYHKILSIFHKAHSTRTTKSGISGKATIWFKLYKLIVNIQRQVHVIQGVFMMEHKIWQNN